MTYCVTVQGKGEFGEWRDAARALRMADIAPQQVDWRIEGGEDLFAANADNAGMALPPPVEGQTGFSVPADFIRLAQSVLCHSDPARFDLLYRILFRLKRERELLLIPSDPDMVAARAMSKSVARDYHKMTAFVRFKEVPLGEGVAGRRRFIAWFEPDHFIIARVAPFFQRRFTDMDWLIATPKGSASWDGAQLVTSHEPAPKPDLDDAAEDLWRTYFVSIFNPARLKVKMMMSEMPKKYWKNLPEADLIPGMIAGAEAQVIEMAARQASEPKPFHHRIREAAAAMPEAALPAAGTLAALRAEAATCSRCELHCHATQTVFGEGPDRASVMVVGEQPGDREDLAGRPFVGPAGRLLDTVFTEAGLDRSKLYVTNAVKHFKYEPRGKRRIHQTPDRGEVLQCRWWLMREIELVQPKVIVALGATALYALSDITRPLSEMRASVMTLEGGTRMFITVHPSYLLRQTEPLRKAEEMARFQREMNLVSHLAAEAEKVIPPVKA